MCIYVNLLLRLFSLSQITANLMLAFMHAFKQKHGTELRINNNEIKKLKYVRACMRFCHWEALNIEHQHA